MSSLQFRLRTNLVLERQLVVDVATNLKDEIYSRLSLPAFPFRRKRGNIPLWQSARFWIMHRQFTGKVMPLFPSSIRAARCLTELIGPAVKVADHLRSQMPIPLPSKKGSKRRFK